MQRMELSLLIALPVKKRSLVPDSQAAVHEIVVTAIKDSEMQAELTPE